MLNRYTTFFTFIGRHQATLYVNIGARLHRQKKVKKGHGTPSIENEDSADYKMICEGAINVFWKETIPDIKITSPRYLLPFDTPLNMNSDNKSSVGNMDWYNLKFQ